MQVLKPQEDMQLHEASSMMIIDHEPAHVCTSFHGIMPSCRAVIAFTPACVVRYSRRYRAHFNSRIRAARMRGGRGLSRQHAIKSQPEEVSNETEEGMQLNRRAPFTCMERKAPLLHLQPESFPGSHGGVAARLSSASRTEIFLAALNRRDVHSTGPCDQRSSLQDRCPLEHI